MEYVKRVLALDVGEKRIGVSVSDPLGITAQGVETIFSRGAENDRKRILELLAAYETDILVVGLPVTMNGEMGYQAERVKSFIEPLESKGIRIIWQDERLTTVFARNVLSDAGYSTKKRKKVIDKIASVGILQTFLDSGGLDRI